MLHHIKEILLYHPTEEQPDLKEDILVWAKEWHYPALLLSRSPRRSIQAGKEGWTWFLGQATQDDLVLIVERIQAHGRRLQGESEVA